MNFQTFFFDEFKVYLRRFTIEVDVVLPGLMIHLIYVLTASRSFDN